MKKTFWLFERWDIGARALFETEKEADEFRKKIDIALIQDPEIGKAMDEGDYEIVEVELNPDFKGWI